MEYLDVMLFATPSAAKAGRILAMARLQRLRKEPKCV